jgi:hypothetical protein
VHAAGGVLHEEQDIQPLAQQRIDAEDVGRENALCLDGQELSSGEAIAARRGVDAGLLEDRPHRARRNRVAKPSKLTPDAPVTPRGVLCGQPQDQPAQLGRRATACGATAGLGPALLDQVPVPSHDRGWSDDPRQLAGLGQQPVGFQKSISLC